MKKFFALLLALFSCSDFQDFENNIFYTSVTIDIDKSNYINSVISYQYDLPKLDSLSLVYAKVTSIVYNENKIFKSDSRTIISFIGNNEDSIKVFDVFQNDISGHTGTIEGRQFLYLNEGIQWQGFLKIPSTCPQIGIDGIVLTDSIPGDYTSELNVILGFKK